VLGTATADIVVGVHRFPAPGEHLPAASPGWRLGGGTVNLACGVVAAGHRAELLGPLGDDAMARALEVAIQRYGITTARFFQVSAPSPRTLIRLDPGGEGRFSALTMTSPRRHTP
jgi:ribokinase